MDKKPDTAHVDVRYVAELARVDLTDEEIRQFEGELEDILGYVAQLNELNVDGIEPTAHAAPRVNVMRADEVRGTLERERVIDNAPASVDDAYIRVPVVLEEGSSS